MKTYKVIFGIGTTYSLGWVAPQPWEGLWDWLNEDEHQSIIKKNTKIGCALGWRNENNAKHTKRVKKYDEMSEWRKFWAVWEHIVLISISTDHGLSLSLSLSLSLFLSLSVCVYIWVYVYANDWLTGISLLFSFGMEWVQMLNYTCRSLELIGRLLVCLCIRLCCLFYPWSSIRTAIYAREHGQLSSKFYSYKDNHTYSPLVILPVEMESMDRPWMDA